MLNLFRKYVIGGRTGSREGAWFLVLTLAVGPFSALAIAEFFGRPMPNAWGALMVIGPAALAIWSAAHGLEKAKDSGWIAKKSVPGEDVVNEIVGDPTRAG